MADDGDLDEEITLRVESGWRHWERVSRVLFVTQISLRANNTHRSVGVLGGFHQDYSDLGSFLCRPRLRWSPTLHGSFVSIQIPLPDKRTMANIARERFWPATCPCVSLEVEAARESTSACYTYMHRDWLNLER